MIVVILLAGLGRLWAELRPYPELTDEEKRQVERLDGRLDSLLPAISDLEGFPAVMNDCTTPDNRFARDYDLEFFNLSGGQQVEEIENVENDDVPRGDIEFCDETEATWVGATVGLARDKVTVDFWRDAHSDFAHGDEVDLSLLSQAYADYFDDQAVIHEVSWVDSSSLGPYGYGGKYLISRPEWPGQPSYTYYEFSFVEGVISGTLHIRFPAGSGDDDAAISLAAAFYQRVRDQVRESSVAAR